MGTKKQTLRKLVKKNKTRNNQMNGGGISFIYNDPKNPSYGGDWLVLHHIAKIRKMKINEGNVVSVDNGSVITDSGYTKNRQPVPVLNYYQQKMEEYFVLCTHVMSEFYNFCKDRENKGKFSLIKNNFTESLGNLKNPLTKNNFGIPWDYILFFPVETVSKDTMDYILLKPENCLLLSQYIRHMKKIIMGFSKNRFKPTYDHRKYPEWDSLSWPKIEFGLNKMLDKQFCDDIKNEKFTLTSIGQNSDIYPPFFNPHNTDTDAFTSFTIDGASDVSDVSDVSDFIKYHNELLNFLQNTYSKNPDTSIESNDVNTVTTGGKRRKIGGKNTRRNKQK